MADGKDPRKRLKAENRPAGRRRKRASKPRRHWTTGSEESKFKPRLRETYREQVVPALMKEFGYKNVMQVPKLERIVLNVGMGEAIQNVKLLESAARELGTITGQKAGGYQGEEGHRRLQVAPRHADRDQGHVAEPPDVRVFRSPGQPGVAAHSRFPRRVAKGVRRPRQLYAWV